MRGTSSKRSRRKSPIRRLEHGGPITSHVIQQLAEGGWEEAEVGADGRIAGSWALNCACVCAREKGNCRSNEENNGR